MNWKTIAILLACCWLSLVVPAVGQIDLTPPRFDFEPELSYDPAIPSPAQFLGYELGERFTLYADAVAYFRALAAASDRIHINQYGTTYEGRPLINLVVSAPEHIDRLEEIRTEHARLVQADALTDEQTRQLHAELPVVTSFSYNIHGNEASSTEAAMQVAYRMAAAQDEATLEALRRSLVLMFICINPDGRDRYVYWYRGVARQQVGYQPRDLEHYAPWPNGRTNHYWFDLNRDWVWGIHPESRGHVAEYQRWMPQVHVDYHEQSYNSNYFTTPGTTPRNLLLPDDYEPFADYFGRANIAQFDKFQLNYFTRDAFDFFYPGYGSSYPSVMGAVGMLTEQGGISAGRAVETDDGYILLLRQRVFDHYTTSIATIMAAAARKEDLLQYSSNAWKAGSSKSSVRTYLLPAAQGGYLQDVLGILHSHGVSIGRAEANFTMSALDYRSGQRQRHNFRQGDYIISADQSRHLFIHALLEPALEIEDSVMYDMATWSAPLAYNLEVYSSDQAANVDVRTLEALPETTTQVVGPGSGYAYVIDWSQRHAPTALALLWQKEYRVRAASEAFTDEEGRTFPAGSLIILRGRNLDRQDRIADDMAAVAQEAGVQIFSLAGGRMRSGYDLASTRNRPVKQPKVALLIDPPFSVYTSGQIYFLFDWETKLPIERIRTSILRQTAVPKFGQRYGLADLEDYDVLILPGGGSHLKKVFGKEEQAQLKTWIQGGGVLVATEDAAQFFTAENTKMTEISMLKSEKDTSDAALYLPYDQREDYYGKKRVPGSALRARVDTSHPLAFGMPADLYALKFGNDALRPHPELQTVGHYQRDSTTLLAAGYASQANLDRLAGGVFAAVLPLGQGKVVYLLDNTQYRMFWRGPSRLMQNAVMLLPGF